jgi:PAS domain S-box-containing protein
MIRPLLRWLSALTKKLPLRLILVVPFVLQIALVVGLTAWLSIQNGYQAVNEVVGQFRDETSNHIQQYLEAYITTPHIINRLNSDLLNLQHLSLRDLPTLEQYLWHQIQSFDAVNEIKFGTEQGGFVAVEKLADGSFVSKMASQATGSVYRVYRLDQQGTRTQLVDQRANYDPRQRPWYQGAAVSGKATLVDVYQRFSTPKPTIDAISASLPLYDEQRNFVGISSVDLALSEISQFLHDLRIGRSSKIFIVDRLGRLIGSSATQQISDRQGQRVQQIKATDSQDALTQFAARSLLNHFGNWTQITTEQQLDFNLRGKRQFIQVAPLRDDKGLDWRIVLVIPEDDFTEQINANTQTAILLCMVAFAIATGLGIYTARGITTPIFRLSQAAQAIAQGNLEQTVVVKGSAEINVLARSFNQMAQQLQDSFAQLARTNEALEVRVEQRTSALQASEAKFAAAFHSSPYPIGISTFTEGRFVEVNDACCQVVGSSREAIIGQTSMGLGIYQNPADRARIIQMLQETGSVRNLELEMRTPSNKLMTIRCSVELIDLNGETCILWVWEDITDRKQAEVALREREQELRLITDALPIYISYVDADQRYRFVNRAYEVWFKQRRDEILGEPVHKILSEGAYQIAEPYINRVLEGQLTTFEAEMPPGSKYYISATYIPNFDANGQVKGYYGLIMDISDRKRAEEASILDERNRMAREIHDTLAQSFTGILIQVGAATQVLSDDAEATQMHLDTIEELARLGLAEARRSVTALRPQLLEEGDLASALDRLVTQLRSATNARLVYEMQGISYCLPTEAENNLLRIGQEALTNAIKYAYASEIRIELTYDDAQCCLRVKDNGQGFAVISAPSVGGFGLLGMSERAERIGAQLRIESQPGQGTEIIVIVDRERKP